MTKQESFTSRFRRIVIRAQLRDDDYVLYVFNPKYLQTYKLTVAEWRKEGTAARAFDRLVLGTQLMLGLLEVVLIPMLIKILFSHMAHAWIYVLLLIFCLRYGPRQLAYGVASVRWLARHSRKIPRCNLGGGW